MDKGLEDLASILFKHPWKEFMENMTSDNAGEFSKNLLGSFGDEAIKTMAEFSKIPEDQFPIFRAMMKGESNTFDDELEKVKPSKAGDLLLMTGNHPVFSRAIKAGYKAIHPMYENAISTHIAVIHADFICIDAIGKVGVSNRLITEVLTDVEDNWRVIRLKRELSDDELGKIADACAFYLAQPYRIVPNKNSIENFAYCSELARKIYKKAKIQNHGIPSKMVIHPAEFDKLADKSPLWIDVTNDFKDYVDFCRKYEMILRFVSNAFISGLKLNRMRFDDRKNLIKKVKQFESQGKMPKDEADDIAKKIEDMNSNMHHQFWDKK